MSAEYLNCKKCGGELYVCGRCTPDQLQCENCPLFIDCDIPVNYHKCVECGSKICSDCLILCRICFDYNEDPHFICWYYQDEKNIHKSMCEFHDDWYGCKKEHLDDRCSYCRF